MNPALALPVILAFAASGLVHADSDRQPRRLPQQIDEDERTAGEQAKLIEQLWQTPLGRMYHEFLFELKDGESPMKAAHAIVDRLHNDVKMTITRQSALNMLRESLFDNARLTPTVYERLMLLDAGMAIKAQTLQQSASKEFLKTFPLFVGAAILGGSPFVRGSVESLTQDAWRVMRQAFRRQSTARARVVLMARMNPTRYWNRRVFEKWSFKSAYFTLWHSFGGAYIVYQLFRTGSAESLAAQNKIWVYGMQKLVSLDEI